MSQTRKAVLSGLILTLAAARDAAILSYSAGSSCSLVKKLELGVLPLPNSDFK